jgi:YHS domain-containing protein
MASSALPKEVIEMTVLKCAVCGNEVSSKNAEKQDYQEERSYEKYYFCCVECRMEFLGDPNKYSGQSGKHVVDR